GYISSLVTLVGSPAWIYIYFSTPYDSLFIHRECLCDGHVIGLLAEIYGDAFIDRFPLFVRPIYPALLWSGVG
ncbi:MAG: hypothetical protein J7540_14015, partial [Roseofilum sp. SID2]|uniref:hypothetical protein n=1 Tax=unclassified Roseofilum TaxID=2620099 RepID=UPI001B018E7A